jgi:hypothetical protein
MTMGASLTALNKEDIRELWKPDNSDNDDDDDNDDEDNNNDDGCWMVLPVSGQRG